MTKRAIRSRKSKIPKRQSEAVNLRYQKGNQRNRRKTDNIMANDTKRAIRRKTDNIMAKDTKRAIRRKTDNIMATRYQKANQKKDRQYNGHNIMTI